MAITVIRPSEMGSHASFGEELGKYAGQGITGGLQGLAHSKIAQLLGKHERQQQQQQQFQQREQFQQMGYEPEVANFLSSMSSDPTAQLKYAQILAPQQGEIGHIQQLMQQLQPQQQQSMGHPQQPQQQQGGNQDAVMMNLEKLLGGQQGQEQMGAPEQQGTNSLQQNQKLTPAQRVGAYENPQQKFQREQNSIKETNTQQRHIDKTNQKWNDRIDDQAEAAFGQNGIIDAMKQLDDNNELDNPKFLAFLDRVGLNYDFLKKPGSQEFQKMRNEFLTGLKTMFGARITDRDLNIFLQGIPDLMQSKEGRSRLYKNLKLMNDSKEVYRNTRDKIVEANGGKQPSNIRSLTSQFSKQELDGIYDKLRSGFSKHSTGSGFAKLPKPYDFPVNKRIEDSSTGKIYRNTGKKWVEEKGKNG